MSKNLDISCFTNKGEVKQSCKYLADTYKNWTKWKTKCKTSESIPKWTKIRGKFRLKKLQVERVKTARTVLLDPRKLPTPMAKAEEKS